MNLHRNWISKFFGLSCVHNLPKLSRGIRKFTFHTSGNFWPAQKLSHHRPVCPSRIQNLKKISFTLLFGRFWDGRWDNLVNYIVSFFVFALLKSSEKCAVMHKRHVDYLSNMRQVLLFFFQHQTFRKRYLKHSLDLLKRSIKSWGLGYISFLTCKNQNYAENQSI